MIRDFLSTWLKPLLLILLLALGLLGLGALLGILLPGAERGSGWNHLLTLLLPNSQESAGNLLGSIIEFQVGLMALGMTVATILVQLSANRYSSRVIDLFIADRANLAFFSLAIVTPLYAFWVRSGIDSMPSVRSHVLLVFVLITLNMLLLIPYVNYLFRLLKPDEIISRIQSSVHLNRLHKGASTRQIDEASRNLVTSVNQLTDVILSSIANADLNLALQAVHAIRSVVSDGLRFKKQAPEGWYRVPRSVFLGSTAQQLQRNPEHRCWVEFHCMKQLELVFHQAVQRFPELTSAVVQRTREIGDVAQEEGDDEALDVCLLFLNTYLRHGMNARDIRTIFHTFYQYRLLGEHCMASGRLGAITRMAQHFKYYGQECEKKGMGFAIEIAAHDLRVLVEHAYRYRRDAVPDMLKVFLEIDREPEDEAVEAGQRGVRKSQSILAAFFLSQGDEALARRIFEDMRDERPERIRSIRGELSNATSAEFWEIQERGANFYYIPPELRPHLLAFFDWFDEAPERPPRKPR